MFHTWRTQAAPLLMLLALTAACAPETDVTTSFSGLGWSERLRPDPWMRSNRRSGGKPSRGSATAAAGQA